MANYAKITKKTLLGAKKCLWAGFALVLAVQVLFPQSLNAQMAQNGPREVTIRPARRGMAIPPKYEVVASGRVSMTAYSSTVDQTDSTPFITSNGTYVYDGLVAANFLAYDTKVRFPEYFGDKVFTVNDRMNRRYQHRIDVWMPTRGEALQFGLQYLRYEIVKEA